MKKNEGRSQKDRREMDKGEARRREIGFGVRYLGENDRGERGKEKRGRKYVGLRCAC